MSKFFYKSIKHTEFDGGSTDDPRLYILKSAATGFKLPSNVKMQPDMYEFVNSIKIDSDKYIYLLINAMGASEYYGANLNGDWFDEKDLKNYHKTFEQGHVYLDHENSDPEKAIGKIIFSSYNKTMHRVELLVAIDKLDPRSHRVVAQISSGIMPRVSMGTRVPFDVCTICGNKAATRADYCTCAKDMLGKLLPDGRRVAVSNPNCRFFEISILSGTEADPSSGGLAKVASHIASKLKAARIDKESIIDKDVYTEEPAARDISETMQKNRVLCDTGRELDSAQEDLPQETLEDMCNCFPSEDILGTMAGLNMKVRPREFTFIQMHPINGDGYSGHMYRKHTVIHMPNFDDIKGAALQPIPLRWNNGVAEMLAPYLEKRSMTPGVYDPKLLLMNMLRKKTAQQPTIIKDVALEHKYAQYIGTVLLNGAMCSAINSNEVLFDNKLPYLIKSASEDGGDIDFIKLASLALAMDMSGLNVLYGAYIE